MKDRGTNSGIRSFLGIVLFVLLIAVLIGVFSIQPLATGNAVPISRNYKGGRALLVFPTSGIIPNGNFEMDTSGTEKDDISKWDYDSVVHKGNPPTGDDLYIVDDYYFRDSKSLYSYLQTTSVSPFPGDNIVSQYLITEQSLLTTADYISLWIAGDGYTTSSRYAWYISLILEDGSDTHTDILRCDCWGNNEGCTPNHYDYYDATETGADGRTWKRYTRMIPEFLDKSNLTVKIRHYQASWDLTQASSWYRLDNVCFSDSQGTPCSPDIAVTNIVPSDSCVGQGSSISLNTTVENQGNCPETFEVTAYYTAPIPNGDFEKDTAGTSFHDISDWQDTSYVHYGSGSYDENLEIVDDYYCLDNKSVYSYIKSNTGGNFEVHVKQLLSTHNPLNTTSDYVSVWVGGDSYTTSSRYAWWIGLYLSDGTRTHFEKVRCDCWGNNEGCTPNHFDYYGATETGADGKTWKRYTVQIPDSLDKSKLTITIEHKQGSWDHSSTSSYYRLDEVYFSDSFGNPDPDAPLVSVETKTVPSLPPSQDTTITFTWITTGTVPNEYVISSYAHPVVSELDSSDNIYTDGLVRIAPCGDCNADGIVDTPDIVYLINYLFKAGPEPVPGACVGDVKCDGETGLSDAVYLINYVLKSGPAPLEDCCAS